MLILYFAFGIILFIAIAEYLLCQRRHYSQYIFWLIVIIGSMYAAKGYCDFYEDNLTPSEFFCEDEEDDWSCECKFVPPGTPDNYINADGTLSKICLKVVQSTNKETAYKSLELHKEKGAEYFTKAQELCWYIPKLSEREKAKMAFNAGFAMLPGPLHLKLVAAIISLLAQYGICCIDEYYDIDFNMNMCRYHFMLVEAFSKHIKVNGW